MSEFKQYKRKQIAELRPITEEDITHYSKYGHIVSNKLRVVSISDEDSIAGSPKIGDMIARNPENHNDQWLVAKEYFNDNFEELHLTNKEDK